MVCACQLPIETYPDASTWGPILWAILHGLAERAGKVPFKLYYPDERIQWGKLFGALGKTIPCKTCKEHYEEYLKQHPIHKLKDMGNAELYTYVRTWFWELHNWVNGSLEKPTFSLDNLATTYKSVPFRDRMRDLDKPLSLAIKLRGTQLLGYKEFIKCVQNLLALYGI